MQALQDYSMLLLDLCLIKKAFPTALRHAIACSLSNEDCGKSISHSFAALMHAAACTLSVEDCIFGQTTLYRNIVNIAYAYVFSYV